jgi:hypothetical protein
MVAVADSLIGAIWRGSTGKSGTESMFDFREAHFDYQPYPIGLVKNVLSPDVYKRLCDDYPSKDLFEFKPELGNKYSLSEVNNRRNFHRFVATSDTWRKFHAFIKGKTLIPEVLALLREHNIDLGIRAYRIASTKRAGRGSSFVNRLRRVSEVSARFEFSMMDAAGGYILPHTDSPNKLITLVVSMIRPGEWDPAWGGGTEIVWPVDERRSFNRVNKYLRFEDVRILKEWELNPNQCVLFVKTFNSWHAVSPMRGPADAPLRRTLTINIELKP